MLQKKTISVTSRPSSPPPLPSNPDNNPPSALAPQSNYDRDMGGTKSTNKKRNGRGEEWVPEQDNDNSGNMGEREEEEEEEERWVGEHAEALQ